MASDFRFNYKKYRSKSGLTVERLDQLIDTLLGIGTQVSWAQKIFAVIKILAVLGFLIARRFLLEDQMKVDRQEYEQEEEDRMRDGLDEDDLDAPRRDNPQESPPG